jgi:integrase
MLPKMNFTKASIAAITPPDTGYQTYRDAKDRYLQLRVTPTGKSFYYIRKVNGKVRFVKLGKFPELTVPEARRQSAEKSGDVAGGRDPSAERRALRNTMTLAKLFDRYLEQHAKPHKRTWPEDKRIFDIYFNRLQNARITEVNTEDARALHNRVKGRGPYQANRCLALLSKLYTYAKSDGLDIANPCQGVKRFPEHSRDRHLDGDELPRFLEALENESNVLMRDFFGLALWTAQRRDNVQAMAWNEIDLDRALWRIPAHKAKADEDIPMPLSGPALEILKRRYAERVEGAEWVFPSRGKTGHLAESKKVWAALLKRAGITNLRLHDLRRTFGSWQAACGFSLQVIGKTLGHKNQSTTAIYARLNLDPVRNAVEATTDAMLATAEAAKQGGGQDDE